MPRSSVTIDIAAPPERAWSVISDVERWHEWTPSITRVRLLGKRPFGVGSRAFIRQPKLPPALWKVTDIVPGRSFTWVSVAPGLRVSGFHGVEPTIDGSRATLAIEIQGLLGGLWGRLSKEITERYLAYEAAGLKARSEDERFRDDTAKV
jgi:hypothetical protein